MKLIFWFDNPPRVSKGAFNEVSEKWDDEVRYYCTEDTREERKRINWDEGGYGKAKMTIVGNLSDSMINDIICDTKNDIHLFCGYRGTCAKYLDKLLSVNRKAKIIVWAERPGVYGAKAAQKKMLLYVFHKLYAIKYRKKVAAIMPLGLSGARDYIRYGWSEKQVYSYGYIPPTLPVSRYLKETNEKCIRFVYVGRFTGSTKGLDVLMAAIDKVHIRNYSVDLVGGYGDLTEKVNEWASKKDNIRVLGSWPINESRDRLKEYDVCIVPSRFDGWNVTINDSLLAGTGVITTTAAGSDELVSQFNAGIVIETGDADQLARAIESAMSSPNSIRTWSNNAQKYAELISPKAAAEYVIRVIHYVFEDQNGKRPVAPWIR